MKLDDNDIADDDPVNEALQFQNPDNQTQTMTYLERTLAWNGTWIPVDVSYQKYASLIAPQLMSRMYGSAFEYNSFNCFIPLPWLIIIMLDSVRSVFPFSRS